MGGGGRQQPWWLRLSLRNLWPDLRRDQVLEGPVVVFQPTGADRFVAVSFLPVAAWYGLGPDQVHPVVWISVFVLVGWRAWRVWRCRLVVDDRDGTVGFRDGLSRWQGSIEDVTTVTRRWGWVSVGLDASAPRRRGVGRRDRLAVLVRPDDKVVARLRDHLGLGNSTEIPK